MARGLRQVDRRAAKALAEANKAVSQRIVDKAQPAVAGLSSPGGSKAQSGIRPRATAKSAKIALLGSNPTIRANVFGTLSHQVYGRTIPGSGPFLPWVGASWDPEQLYGLGGAITSVADGFALDEYLDAYMDALAVAFPH